MKRLWEAQLRCKDPNCKLYDKWQTIRFEQKLDFFGENPVKRKCTSCGSTDVTYTGMSEVFLGMSVQEAIKILSRFDANAILSLEIEFPTCENGTCFDYATNYVYDIYKEINK